MGIFYPRAHATLLVYFDGLGDQDSRQLKVELTPSQMSIGLNGYKEADTFSLDFDADRLPFSPEIIREIAVELYLFQTDGLAANIEPYLNNQENLVLTGITEEGEINLSSDGRTFHVSGKDYTSLLAAKPWPDGKKVPSGSDLKQTVENIVQEGLRAEDGRKTLDVFNVIFEADEPKENVSAKGLSSSLTKKRFAVVKPTVGHGRGKSTKAKPLPQQSGRSYWDVIYGLCLQYGYVAYVYQNAIHVTAPKALDTEAIGTALRFSYGKNLASLSISRKFGRQSVPQVICRTYDPHQRKFVEGQWPSDADAAKRALPGKTQKEAMVVAPPPGVTDKGVLDEYCRMWYHSLGRQESSVKMSTHALRDLTDEDILRVRAGRPIYIGWEAFNEEELRQKTQQERSAYLRNLGYSAEVSDTVARSYDKLHALRQPFYCKTAELNWSASDGIEVTVEGINYVSEKRDAKGL